jgi:tetratricopeptide (TPR) repeat protein
MTYFIRPLKKRFFSNIVICTGSFIQLFGASSYEVTTKEEGFMLRRITEFWKDQDYETVKKEIVSFLKTHEHSTFCDQLHGNYGDLLIQEGDYKQALSSYEKIKNEGVVETFLLNQMQCYYELERYEDLIKAGNPYLTKMSKELVERKDEFYFLMGESYFREALKMERSEKKMGYLAQAAPLYEKILDSSFNDPSMFALAEIYRLEGSYEKSQKIFLELSLRHPQRKEELLFHAALAQAEYNRPLAIATFTEIYQLKGEKRGDSALNRLILFFQEEKYDEVIAHYKEVSSLLEKEKGPTLEYIIARSYFSLESYEEAHIHLEQFLSFQEGSKEEMRNALLMQLSTAQILKNEPLYKETLHKFSNSFPNDKQIAQAEFIHAMLLKEMGNPSEAEKILATLIERKKSTSDDELLYLEYGLVSYNNGNWPLSKKTLTEFISKYKESKHLSTAWKHLLSSSLNLLKAHQEEGKKGYSKVDFLNDLNKVLSHKELLDPQECIECAFLQGKLSYEIEKYNDALVYLQSFISSYGQNSHSSEAYLLTALCYHKLGSSYEQFCTHAEKALTLDKSLAHNGALHLELFNAYLTLSKNSEMEKVFTQKARDHLFTALSLGEKNIKLENKLWLANAFLFDPLLESKLFIVDTELPSDKESFDRSFSLYEEVLLDTSSSLIAIPSEKLFLEWEVLKYANLLGRKNDHEKKIQILGALIEKQSKHPQWGWTSRKEALFELAKTYEFLGENDNALETYTFITTLKPIQKSFVEEYSQFSVMRLGFEQLPKSQKNEENKGVFTLLSALKDLQIQKNPPSEPLHLEAALEYAKIRGILSKSKDPHVNYLFFLSRIQEDFTNKQDCMSEKYVTQTQGSYEYSKLFSQYMTFIQAESLRMEAMIKVKDNHIALSVDVSEKAKQLLLSLKKERMSLYLSKRVDESIELLKKGTLF